MAVVATMLVVVLAAMLGMLMMVPVLLTMLWRCRSQYRRRHRPATASKITQAEVAATKDDASKSARGKEKPTSKRPATEWRNNNTPAEQDQHGKPPQKKSGGESSQILAVDNNTDPAMRPCRAYQASKISATQEGNAPGPPPLAVSWPQSSARQQTSRRWGLQAFPAPARRRTLHNPHQMNPPSRSCNRTRNGGPGIDLLLQYTHFSMKHFRKL